MAFRGRKNITSESKRAVEPVVLAQSAQKLAIGDQRYRKIILPVSLLALCLLVIVGTTRARQYKQTLSEVAEGSLLQTTAVLGRQYFDETLSPSAEPKVASVATEDGKTQTTGNDATEMSLPIASAPLTSPLAPPAQTNQSPAASSTNGQQLETPASRPDSAPKSAADSETTSPGVAARDEPPAINSRADESTTDELNDNPEDLRRRLAQAQRDAKRALKLLAEVGSQLESDNGAAEKLTDAPAQALGPSNTPNEGQSGSDVSKKGPTTETASVSKPVAPSPTNDSPVEDETTRNCADDVGLVAKSLVISFAVNSSVLTEVQMEQLRRFARVAVPCSTAKIIVTGHSDPTGPSEENYSLSWARAESVAKALREAGLEDTRLDVIGYGSRKRLTTTEIKRTSGVAPGTNELSRKLALDRRVEIEVR
ncbi:MAG: OmpA family protein [Pseudomonadota bacterium]